MRPWQRSVPDDQVVQRYLPAAKAALSAFSLAPERIELVSVSENVTFRVTTAEPPHTYVLRLHRPGYHTLEELESEGAWIEALGNTGIAVPRAMTTPDGASYVLAKVAATGEQRYAGLSIWTEGEILAHRLRNETDGTTLFHAFGQLGAMMAAMHNQASSWQAPSHFKRHRFDKDGLIGESPFWGPFWNHPDLTQAELALVINTRDQIRVALDRYGYPPHTFSMIHADLHPGNLVLTDSTLTVIDFDDAGFGWHQYDIAVALFSYRSNPHYQAIQKALLDGYRRHRNLASADADLIPMFQVIRGLVSIGWILQRPELNQPLSESFRHEVCDACRRLELPF